MTSCRLRPQTSTQTPSYNRIMDPDMACGGSMGQDITTALGGSKAVVFRWPLVITQAIAISTDLNSSRAMDPDITMTPGGCIDFSYLPVPHCHRVSSSTSLHTAQTSLGFAFMLIFPPRTSLPHPSITYLIITVAPASGHGADAQVSLFSRLSGT